MHLVMDIDLILPLLLATRDRKDMVPLACVTEELLRQPHGLGDTLEGLHINFIRCGQDQVSAGRKPALGGVRAVVSASESTANPHRPAHVLTQRANRSGIRTYTVQHGFENIGLTYFDHVHSIENIRFASRKIFTWGPLSELHNGVPSETRMKCIPVGIPKTVESISVTLDRPGGRNFLVSVFENLHWHRYDADYAQRFLTDLENCAQKFPDVTFLIKPHPAGKWTTTRYKGSLPKDDNIVVADPRDAKWFPHTGLALVRMSDGTITTPSTVALDAAVSGCPVAVVGYSMELNKYQPLPIIRCSKDWITFVERLRVPELRAEFEDKISCFLERVILPGNACERILDIISADISGQRRDPS